MNNSEILFLYDAKQSNPNGDMDNENKPRMDWDTDTNLVSDLRLKRYIRDYLQKNGLFITADAKDAADRVLQILKRSPTKDKPVTEEELQNILNACIDARLFGVVLGTPGGNAHLTGPIQFNWGYSLNKVELQESKTITSSFSSGEGVGKDYRVNYSFLAFSGTINALLSNTTKLSDNDIKLFDEAMVKSIPASKTRSKTGQTPRLYLRVELNSNKTFLKDLREYIALSDDIKNKRDLRSINDIQLDLSRLETYLKNNQKNIEKIIYWQDDNFQVIKIVDNKWCEITANKLEFEVENL